MRLQRTAGTAVVGALVAGLGTPVAMAAGDAAPDATITSPGINDQVFKVAKTTFTGTATDDVGVASLGIAFQDQKTRLWYRPDGTFGAYYRFPVTFSTPGAKSVNWTYTWTPPVNGAYLVQVVAKDTAGHADSVLPFRRFYNDDRNPDTAITSPVSTATRKIKVLSTVTFSGTATDNFRVGYLNVAIQNRSTHKWLHPDGRFSTGYYAFRKPVDHSGAASTTWQFKQKFWWSGPFLVQVGAVDQAGDVDPTQPLRRFDVVK